MKLLTFVLGVLVIISFCRGNKMDALSTALRNISRVLFEQRGVVEVVKLANDEKTIEDKILKSALDQNIPVNVTKLKIRERNSDGIYINWDDTFTHKSSIVSIGSLTTPDMFIDTFVMSSSRFKDGLFYFHCYNESLSNISQYLKHRFMKFATFIVEEKTSIRLLANKYFPSENCVRGGLSEINRFSKKTMEWTTNHFTFGKFNNFHGCNLTLSFGPESEADKLYASEFYRVNFTGPLRYVSLIKTIYEELADHLNYKLDTRELSKSADLVPLSYYSDSHGNHPFTLNVIKPYLVESVYFAVPVGEEYNGFEKLVLPFDNTVWLLIIVTFVAAFTTIFVLKFTSHQVREFVIGRTVKTPVLNVLMAAFGISQITVPGRNFARFLVMNFIIYCLVMRTAWQGKMFEFLQKDMRKPEVRTIEEMEEKNFTLYVRKYGMTSPTNNLQILTKDATKTKYNFRLDVLLEASLKLGDSSFKGAVEVQNEVLKFQAIATNGTFLKRINKKHPFKTRFISHYLGGDMGTVLFETFAEQVHRLFAGGFINYYDRDYREYTKPERYEHLHPDEPKVLTMEHLEAGFIVSFVPLIFATIAFVFEWIPRLIEYVVFKNVFISFYRIKRCESQKNFNFKKK